MSVSMETNSYPPTDWSTVSVTPAVTNVTGWERNTLLVVGEVMVLAVILVMALLSNSLVLAVLLRRRQHRNPLHQFMLNLCLADLVVALFQVLVQPLLLMGSDKNFLNFHSNNSIYSRLVSAFYTPPLTSFSLRCCLSWCGTPGGAFLALTSCVAW